MASTPGLLEHPGAARPADTDDHSAATSEAEGSPVPHSRSEVRRPRFRKMEEEGGCSCGAESVRVGVGLLIKAGLSSDDIILIWHVSMRKRGKNSCYSGQNPDKTK